MKPDDSIAKTGFDLFMEEKRLREKYLRIYGQFMNQNEIAPGDFPRFKEAVRWLMNNPPVKLEGR